MLGIILCIAIYLIEMFNDKLKNLVVSEVTIEPWPGEVTTGNYEELAEDEETFVENLGVEETSGEIDEIDDLVGEEVKGEYEDNSVIKFMIFKLINTS